ncbi:MAG: hypothetical protein UV01_C0003G0047 [Parcubacteria group bacterium GW2011_GWA2_42_14]|nr:MAG: hypothetical protein UV01_C0003G0047 [Parcubacteria group bacterium GW2011_GWA2_42_14]
MKKICSLIIMLSFLFIPSVFAGVLDNPSHPIFSQENWVFDGSKEYADFDPDGTKVIYTTFNLYRNPDHSSYSLEESIVFGETVVKVYYLEDKEKGLYENAFRLEKDGVWHDGGVVLWPRLIRDSSGKILRALLIMIEVVDGKFKTVMTREVERK